MIPVFIVNRVLAAARYAVELANEGRIVIDWKDVKHMYDLAEYLLNQ